MKMKIAIWHNLPSGGGKRALFDHVHGLLERGHQLEAWCPPTADQAYLPLNNLIPEHIVDMRSYDRSRRNPLTRFMNLFRLTAGKYKALEEHCKLCADQINRGNFDILFANSTMYYAVPPIARYIKIPAVLYLQEPYRFLYEASPISAWVAPYYPKKNKHFINYMKSFVFDFSAVQWLRIQVREEFLSAQAFDRILVNSHFSRESVLRAYGLNAKVCYLGVDTNRFTYQKMARQPYLIGIGAIIPNKNIEFIIDAVGCLLEPRPKLVWIGNQSNASYLEDLVSLARERQIVFEVKQHVDDHELVVWLNQASMMVYAPRLEPFGYAPLEANACGAPVIAVAEGGVRETVKDGINGFLVDDDPHKMAEAIERLLKDPVTARQMEEQAVEYVSNNWSINAAISRLEDNLSEQFSIGRQRTGSVGFDKNAYWKNWTS